jgi:hypothetical protein
VQLVTKLTNAEHCPLPIASQLSIPITDLYVRPLAHGVIPDVRLF